MISAESSSVRLPAPVPRGGALAGGRRADGGELPLLRLMERRQPGAGDVAARHRLCLTADHGVNHELGRQVAACRGHDGGADRELSAQANASLEFLPAHDLETAQRGGGGIEASRGGANEGGSGERREGVHHDAAHLPPPETSRERRYIAVASSGRFNRSSTLPMP